MFLSIIRSSQPWKAGSGIGTNMHVNAAQSNHGNSHTWARVIGII